MIENIRRCCRPGESTPSVSGRLGETARRKQSSGAFCIPAAGNRLGGTPLLLCASFTDPGSTRGRAGYPGSGRCTFRTSIKWAFFAESPDIQAPPCAGSSVCWIEGSSRRSLFFGTISPIAGSLTLSVRRRRNKSPLCWRREGGCPETPPVPRACLSWRCSSGSSAAQSGCAGTSRATPQRWSAVCRRIVGRGSRRNRANCSKITIVFRVSGKMESTREMHK